MFIYLRSNPSSPRLRLGLPDGIRSCSFASDVSGKSAIDGAIRAGIIAYRFRRDLLLVDASEAPAAIVSETRKSEHHDSVSQKYRVASQSSPPEEPDGA